MIQRMLAIWSLVPLSFQNPPWTSGSSQFTYCWRLAWKILSITLLACEMNAILWWFEHSLALPFFGIEMKTDLFQSCVHCWVSQICWPIECSTFTASSFRIWGSSTGILSPLLALFIVMFHKVHLTPHSRMSGSRWVIIPLWLSGSWRSLLYSSSVYSWHLFLISSASVRSIPFFKGLLIAFLYCSGGSQGRNAELVHQSLLQWTTFCLNSPPCPGWPYTASLIASLSCTRLCSTWSVWLVFCDCGFHSVCPLMDEDKRFVEASWWEGLAVGKTVSYSGEKGHAQ